MNVPIQILIIRLIIVLGIINLITGVLIFFSCRCVVGSKLGGKLMEHKAYQRFNKYHCYIWSIFWPSVMVHAILVLAFLGWPG